MSRCAISFRQEIYLLLTCFLKNRKNGYFMNSIENVRVEPCADGKETIESDSKTITQQKGPLSKQQELGLKVAIGAYLASAYLTPFLSRSSFCVNDLVPGTLMKGSVLAGRAIALLELPFLYAVRSLPPSFQNLTYILAIAPLFEETVCRGLFQEVLLKKAPVSLLRHVNEKSARWWESSIYAKVGRIALSALFFASLHLDPENCALSNRAISEIGLGIGLATVMEFKEPKHLALTGAILLHAVNNAAAYALACLGKSYDPLLNQSC